MAQRRIKFTKYKGSAEFEERSFILQGQILVGRECSERRTSKENLIFGNGVISKVHAELFQESNQVFVVDRLSTNGTKVNGVRLGSDQHEDLFHELKSGDIIQFGAFANNVKQTLQPIIGRIEFVMEEEDEHTYNKMKPFSFLTDETSKFNLHKIDDASLVQIAEKISAYRTQIETLFYSMGSMDAPTFMNSRLINSEFLTFLESLSHLHGNSSTHSVIKAFQECGIKVDGDKLGLPQEHSFTLLTEFCKLMLHNLSSIDSPKEDISEAVKKSYNVKPCKRMVSNALLLDELTSKCVDHIICSTQQFDVEVPKNRPRRSTDDGTDIIDTITNTKRLLKIAESGVQKIERSRVCINATKKSIYEVMQLREQLEETRKAKTDLKFKLKSEEDKKKCHQKDMIVIVIGISVVVLAYSFYVMLQTV